MKGPIRAIPRQRTLDRSDVRVPAVWLQTDRGVTLPRAGKHLSAGLGPTIPTREPVLLLLGAHAGALAQRISEAAAAEARFYGIADAAFRDQARALPLDEATRVLLRKVTHVPATGWISSDRGQLWLTESLSLSLDADQVRALRQVFLRLFWHEATEEAFSGAPVPAWRPARARPFDVPLSPSDAAILTTTSADLGSAAASIALIDDAKIPPGRADRLWVRPSAEAHDKLAPLRKAGVPIGWEDLGLPPLRLRGGEGELLIPAWPHHLRVRLNGAQARELAKVLEGPTRWRFEVDATLGDPELARAGWWLPGAAGPSQRDDDAETVLPGMTAPSLRTMATTEPTSLPEPHPLAVRQTWTWTVTPPLAPSSAKADPLVGAWAKADRSYAERIDTAREALRRLAKERSRISQGFRSLVAAALGFERTGATLSLSLDQIAQETLSALGPADARRLLARLDKAEQAIRKLGGDLEAAERQAREEQEREQQRAAWEKRKKEADERLPTLRDDVARASDAATALGEELKAAEDEASAGERTKSEKKQDKARIARLRDDLRRAEREVEQRRTALATAEQDASSTFSFQPEAKPPALSGARKGFIPETAERPPQDVPSEALPSVGALHRAGKERYLVIERWEDLDEGEREAARLGAHLVAVAAS